MKELKYLKEMLCDELGRITQQKEFTPSTLEAADKIVDMMKDIDEIEEKERMMEYSEDASYGYGYNYNDDMRSFANNRYAHGNNYARGGNNSGDNGRNYSGRNYDRGYSRHTATEKMVEELQMMMDDASSQRDKDVIQRALEELRK